MEKSTDIKKFVLNEKSFYGKTVWKPNGDDLFHIKLYDGDTTWSGRFSYEVAKKYKDRCDETEEQYYDNVKKALSKDQHFNYVFTTPSDDNKFGTFSWKKKFEDSLNGTAYLVHGSVSLHREEDTESRDILVDLLLTENEDLKHTIATLSSKNNDLTIDLAKCKKDLDKFADIKTTLETTLYGKFVQVLNAKKRRIQLLEDDIRKIIHQNTSNSDEVD